MLISIHAFPGLRLLTDFEIKLAVKLYFINVNVFHEVVLLLGFYQNAFVSLQHPGCL